MCGPINRLIHILQSIAFFQIIWERKATANKKRWDAIKNMRTIPDLAPWINTILHRLMHFYALRGEGKFYRQSERERKKPAPHHWFKWIVVKWMRIRHRRAIVGVMPSACIYAAILFSRKKLWMLRENCIISTLKSERRINLLKCSVGRRKIDPAPSCYGVDVEQQRRLIRTVQRDLIIFYENICCSCCLLWCVP